MITLIPVYTAVISVLHNTVSKDVGAYLIEHLVTLLVDELTNANTSSSVAPDHKFIIYSQFYSNLRKRRHFMVNLNISIHIYILNIRKT
jgi:hypothetical protein